MKRPEIETQKNRRAVLDVERQEYEGCKECRRSGMTKGVEKRSIGKFTLDADLEMLLRNREGQKYGKTNVLLEQGRKGGKIQKNQ